MDRSKPLVWMSKEVKTPPFSTELRMQDQNQIWRIIYATEPDAIVILEVFSKKTSATAKRVNGNARKRISLIELFKDHGQTKSQTT